MEDLATEIKPSRMPPMRRNSPDDFQTPPFAVRYLTPYLDKSWKIWECAEGKGNIVNTLKAEGFTVEGSDLKSGTDFLKDEPYAFDAIVTTPPFSIKDKFLRRCYDFGKPFALLMPVTGLVEQGRLAMYRKYGIQLLVPPKRINFETPSGTGTGAQFFCMWFCFGLNLPEQITFITPDGEQEGML